MNSEEVSTTGGLGPPSDHLQNTKGKKRSAIYGN